MRCLIPYTSPYNGYSHPRWRDDPHSEKHHDLTLKTQHRFSEMFVAFLISRNARYQEALADQLFNSTEKRLARVLLRLAQFGKRWCGRAGSTQDDT
jgi:hypothetical protein